MSEVSEVLAFRAQWARRLDGALGSMNDTLGGPTRGVPTSEDVSWDSLRNRFLTVSAAALGLSFLTLQFDEPQQPGLIPWNVLLMSVGLLLASMAADWLIRYVVLVVTGVHHTADQLGGFSAAKQSGILRVRRGQVELAVVLAAVVVVVSRGPKLVKFLEKPAGIVGMGLLFFAAFRLIEFARANV